MLLTTTGYALVERLERQTDIPSLLGSFQKLVLSFGMSGFCIGDPTERLCLIYSGAPLDRAAARRWLRARLDPVFLPRDFIRLDRLPRSDTGKLPLHSLDLAYSSWQAAARLRRGKRSAPLRERALA